MASTKLHAPFSDFVMLDPVEEDRVTKTGLYIPDNAGKEKPRVGRIVEVGPDVYSVNEKGEKDYNIKVGQYVLFSPYTGEKVEVNVEALKKKRYHFVRQDALICRVTYEEDAK